MLKFGLSRLIATAGGFALLAALVQAGPSGAAPIRAGQGPDCTPVLDKPLGGVAAVEALGANIERGAKRAGMTAAKFARALRTDSTLRVDVCGYPFYVDPATTSKAKGARAADGHADEAHGAAAADSPVVGQTLVASGNVFALSSRPGSMRTIYLDFNGATISGTAWNNYAGVATIVAPAFSLDTDGSTFTAAEQDVIRQVWLRVAEDYAPFDVNVTTADPGFAAINRSSSSDLTYGSLALITNDTLVYTKCGRCGGVAYVGTFDMAGINTYYQPAWVFQRGTGGSAKYMAEAASQEVGHNLGLNHDGTVANGSNPAQGYYTGHGAWAPIMGLGYNKPVTQWSEGEYDYANNLQDDLAVINSRGLRTAADDHSDVAAKATALRAGTTVSGIIGADRDFWSSYRDIDWFGFSAAGAIMITARPQAVGANLDIGLKIFNSAGALVASADPASAMVNESTATGLDATVNVTLSSGIYYAVVDGMGFADPRHTGYSDYGSLGRYEISLTVPQLVVSTSSLPNGTALAAYSTGLAATGGTPPYSWALSAGAVPAGLSLSSAGVISGTPTASGTANFTVRVTDASGASATRALSLVIAPAAVTVTTSALPDGGVSTFYSTGLAATGGTPPYSWALSAGAVPAGLSLSSAGVISGTPTASGTANFTVRVTDASGASATRALSLHITPTPLNITTTALPTGESDFYYATLNASGGTSPYSWTVSAGALPADLTLSSDGVIQGWLYDTGYHEFDVRVTDAAGAAAVKRLSIQIRSIDLCGGRPNCQPR